jgi:glycosyltransferase involved in cell wall biosynthesis
MKIALLTFECPPADYRSLSFPNKEKYCLKHGYDFLSYTERASDRPPSWDKIKYLRKHIDNYDWIFWTDSDSVIVNDKVRLETFIDTEKDLVIQLDEASDKTKAINAGQIFLRNSEWGKWFLGEAWNNEKYGTSIDHSDWEQACIKAIIGDCGEKFPDRVCVYKDLDSGFNVVPPRATFDTFIVHYRREHRDNYKEKLKHLFSGPKLVHRVWMGPKENLEEEDYHSSSFKKHLPDWKNKDWEDSDEEEIRELMLEIDPRLLVCFEKYSKYFVVRADVIRHCVLYKYGGIYTDYDVELYSQSLHEKIKEDPDTPLFMVETVLSDEFKKFTSGFSNRNGEEECKTRIGSYLLYSPPKNKIIKSIINLIAERLSQDIEIKEDYDIIWMTGPDTISTVVNSTKEKFNLISLREQHNICEHKLTGVATWRQTITEGKKNILYISGFGGSSGYSQAARGYAKILSRNKDINFKILSTNSLWENNKSSRWVAELSPYLLDHRGIPHLKEQEYTVIYHIEPSQQNLNWNSRQCSIDLGDLLNNSSKNISAVAWEADKIPSNWKQFYKKYNFSSVVVSSTYQKNVFESSLDIPIYNTPYAVEVNKSAKNVLNESFSILGVSQWSYRKGFDILIQAFNAEFYNDPNVSLTIKTYGMLWDPNDKKNILREIEEYKANTAQINNQPKCTIKYWYGDITRDQLQNLYGEADLFALATRGEGFGLTIAEALLNGKRVLVPDKGGHVDYIHKNNYWIKSRLETLRCAGWSANYSSEFKLIEPDFEDTRVKLRQAYNDFKNSKQEWANKQKESTIFTKNYLSEDIIKKKLEEIIKCQINKIEL